ncbi:hypothetical protein ACU47R_004886, partial [Shigella sonnei]
TSVQVAKFSVPLQSGQDVLVNKNEHLADAVAAIHTGMQTDQFRQVRDVLKSLI